MEEQAKQRGSVPHLPIRDYCPHPSNHLRRRFHLSSQLIKYTIFLMRLASAAKGIQMSVGKNIKPAAILTFVSEKSFAYQDFIPNFF